MRWNEISESNDFIANPFSSSVVKDVMYHASHTAGIKQFKRSPAGVWFAETPTWGKRLYGDQAAVYACYLDVRNPYYPSEDEVDEYYGEMEKIPPFFAELERKGFDAYVQGGESGSIAVFSKVKIVNAETGEQL